MKNKKIEGNIVDIFNRKIFKGEVEIENNKIKNIIENNNNNDYFILPGLIDSHVHIESSMLIPSEFSKLAIMNGTVGIVTDPHEIANVMGIEGIEFMIKNAKQSPLKCYFCVPSCVPTSENEISGAVLDAEKVEFLFKNYNLKILGELMDYSGVINNNPEVYKKIKIAQKYNAVIDGHIPNIIGNDLEKYISAGISTDHECSYIEEAIDKIQKGMKIQIREGSAAKNFDSLFPLITKYNKNIMLCTDDSHPDDLLEQGHINKIIKKGLKLGINIFDLLTTTCINPVEHYKLDVGLLRKNDPADFIIVDNLQNFNILETNINGETVFSNNRILYNTQIEKPINNFNTEKITIEDIEIKSSLQKIKVIEVVDKELITKCFYIDPLIKNGKIISDIKHDILKIVVYCRYKKEKAVVGFINGFGLQAGAIASSVSHDSHNIIAVGADDESIVKSINEIIENKGGLCYVKEKNFYTLALEFGGLMTGKSGETVAKMYKELNNVVKVNGCNLTAAFMTLAFMSLLVIPHLKINTKGIFDVDKYEFTKIFE